MQRDGLFRRLDKLVRSWYGLAILIMIIAGIVGASATVALLLLGDSDTDPQSVLTSVSPMPTSTVATPSPSPDTLTPDASPERSEEPASVPSGITCLESGTVLEESLERPGETDEWTICGSEGEFVEVRMNRDPTGDVRPNISLVDPFGGTVTSEGSGYDRDYALIEYTLESTGEFTVIAKSQVEDGTGRYRLTFLIDGFKKIDPDTTLVGELAEAGQKDRYVFDAQAGETVSVRVDRDPTGNVRPQISLIDPFGNKDYGAGSGYQGEYAQLETKLEDTGTFTIVVEDRQLTGIGKYTLEVTLR